MLSSQNTMFNPTMQILTLQIANFKTPKNANINPSMNAIINPTHIFRSRVTHYLAAPKDVSQFLVARIISHNAFITYAVLC